MRNPKKPLSMTDIINMLGGLNIWGPILVLILMAWAAMPAHAETVTQGAAEQYCRQHIVEVGGEVATNLQISGPTWHAWGREIPGDTITATFAQGTIILSEQNSTMADHVLTILQHRAKGIELLAAQFPDGDETVATLTIPSTVNFAGDGPGCFHEWLVR